MSKLQQSLPKCVECVADKTNFQKKKKKREKETTGKKENVKPTGKGSICRVEKSGLVIMREELLGATQQRPWSASERDQLHSHSRTSLTQSVTDLQEKRQWGKNSIF